MAEIDALTGALRRLLPRPLGGERGRVPERGGCMGVKRRGPELQAYRNAADRIRRDEAQAMDHAVCDWYGTWLSSQLDKLPRVPPRGLYDLPMYERMWRADGGER